MTPWSHWALGWWTALVLAVGVSGVVDRRGDQRSNVLARASVVHPDAASGESALLPAALLPVAVEAPAVGISAQVVPVGKANDGSLQLPAFGTAGWYERSARPGAVGSAVLVGHVDSYDGPDIFYALKDLEPGDEVRVLRADGSTVTYVVEHQEQVDKDELPVGRIFDSPAEPALRLVTCGGDFNRQTRSYESNVIVYARLATQIPDG